MTMRLLVGRLTPAIRAKSVTPCGGRATRRGAAAVDRFQCHLEKATNVKGQRLPCLYGPASLLNLRLDISGLLMDSGRFRQPRRAISCTKLAWSSLAAGRRRRLPPTRLAPANPPRLAVLAGADFPILAGFFGRFGLIRRP